MLCDMLIQPLIYVENCALNESLTFRKVIFKKSILEVKALC